MGGIKIFFGFSLKKKNLEFLQWKAAYQTNKGWKNKFFEFNKEILRNKYIILKYRGDAVNSWPIKVITISYVT